MAYFVTGATGFIGRFLVEICWSAASPSTCWCARDRSKKLEALRDEWGADDKARHRDHRRPRAEANLGVADADLKKLKGKIDHFFHLAAIYDLKASAEEQQAANVDGTRHAVRASRTRSTPACFHHVSSIAAAGLYDGVFREDMFEEAEDLDHPYFRTKHDSEGRRAAANASVRSASTAPGFVVGDSQDRLHRQDRRPLLLLQDRSRRCAACCRRGCRWSASRAGASTSCRSTSSPTRSTHIAHKKGLDGKMLPPHRSGAASHRRGAQHLRQGGARAADDDAAQRAHVRLHPRTHPVRHRLAGAGQAHDARGAAPTSAFRRTCSSSSTGRRATTTARRRRR